MGEEISRSVWKKMALEKKYSDSYYMDLLKKYMEEKLSPAELRLLEKKAMDDPFLFEAMQGFSKSKMVPHSEHIRSIRRKLHKKEKRRSIYIRYILPAAAATVLLLFAVSSLIKSDSTSSKPDNQNLMVMNEEEKESASTFDSLIQADAISEDFSISNEAESASGFQSNSLEQNIPAPASTRASRDEEMIQPSSKESGDEIQSKEKLGAMEPNKTIPDESGDSDKNINDEMDDVADESMPVEFEKVKESASENTRRQSESRQREMPSPPPKLKRLEGAESMIPIEGIIYSETKEPLPGVNILSLPSGLGTVTGVDGRFSLDVPSNEENLEISYTGYSRETLDITNNQNVELFLTQTENLSEVTVSDFGSRITAQPVGGYLKFEAYITENIIAIPEIEGEVIVQFRVKKNGSLSQFKIIQSLCEACNEEAIRLIKEGPKWQTNPLNKAHTTTYTIQFQK